MNVRCARGIDGMGGGVPRPGVPVSRLALTVPLLGAGGWAGSSVQGWEVFGLAPMGEGGRLTERGPRAAASGGSRKIRRKKVNVLRYARVRLPLRLSILPGPGPAPLPLPLGSGRRGWSRSVG